MDYDLVIKNGLVITHRDEYAADVAVRGEQIAAIGPGLLGREELDAAGLYVLPGAVDGHVHFTDPSYWPHSPPTADSFATASAAAAFGGTTTVVDFAQPAPGQPLLEALDRRLADAGGHSLIDYGLHLTLRDPDPARLAELPAVFARGIDSLKLFMAYEGYQLDDVALLRAMESAAAHDRLVVVHAENFAVIQELRRRQAAAGQLGPRWHVAACPAVMEGEAVHRALALARLAGARVLLFHQSCAEGVRELRLAKSRGQQAWGEVCIQYLALTDAEYQADTPRARSLAVSPPLRAAEHQAALWAGLADGTLDIVSSDHNPRRAQGSPPVQPPGTSSVEARLALLHTLGVREGRLSRQRWVEVCCTRPAEVFGLAGKGRLEAGCDADIVLFDPRRQITLTPETLHSPLDFCTYQGMVLTGFPVTTLSRGQVLVRDGQCVGRPGHGRFVPRGLPSPGPSWAGADHGYDDERASF